MSLVFLMLVLSTVGLTMSAFVSTRGPSTVANLDGQKAFYVAEGGMQHIVTTYFMNETDFTNPTSPTGAPPSGPDPIALGGGQYWVQYANQTTNSADITITSQVGESFRIIQQSVSRAFPSQPVYVMDEIDLNGNPGVAGGTITGDLGAGGIIAIDPEFTGSFTQTTPILITLPPVEVNSLLYLTTETHAGNLTVPSGAYDKDIYATGDILIQSGASVTGVLIANGTIDVEENVTVIGTLAARGSITLGMNSPTQPSSFTAPNPSDYDNQVLPVCLSEYTIAFAVNGGKDNIVAGMVVAEALVEFVGTGTPLATDTAFTFNGGILSRDDFMSNLSQGNAVINANAATLAAYAERGNIKLQQWQEA